MPPKNVRVARPVAAIQRATRRVTRSASQASSEAESHREAAPKNGNPVEMPNTVNATLLAELQRYRDAYGGQLPNGEATAEAGDNPIPPGAGQNLPPPPPPGSACSGARPRPQLLGHVEIYEEYADGVFQWKGRCNCCG